MTADTFEPRTGSGSAVAGLLCSLADLEKQIRAKARYYKKSACLKQANGWMTGAASDQCRAEAYKESARLIRQCLHNAPKPRRPLNEGGSSDV